jgi:hypothetical protein
MTHLRLAEGKPDITEFYLPYPTKTGVQYIREDFFDDMSDKDFSDYMNALESAGMGEGLSGTMGNKAARQQRRESRQAKKQAKTDVKTAKAEAIKKGTYVPGAGIKNVIGGITDVLGTVTGKTNAGAYIQTKTEDDLPPIATYPVMPKWVLPVGIGAGALILLLVFTRKK